jgi:exodeoxyribonuclease VII small subunit
MHKPPRKLKFEQAMERLDAIVEAMESGQIGIEESIAKFEEAMALAAHCRQVLDQAEQRIRQIQIDAAGKPVVNAFEPLADSAENGAESGADAVENGENPA